MTTKIRGESSADYPARSDGPCPATSISLQPTQTKMASGPGHQPHHDVSSSSRDHKLDRDQQATLLAFLQAL
jgi:hypothetical protein